MKKWTRRDLLKTSVLMPAAVTADEVLARGETAVYFTSMNAAVRSELSGPAPQSSEPGPGRERLLLDFGWRFHFGHADDPAGDFGFGSGRSGNFQKTGNFVPAGALAFDDGDWRPVDLPHDWAIELPFENDPSLSSKGFYPLGRKYPTTSVGWYRRVFDLPDTDAGRRISIEFDGAYRETMGNIRPYPSSLGRSHDPDPHGSG